MGDRPAVSLRTTTIYNLCMAKFDPQKYHRRSIRLKGFDYSSAGAYYVTIVAQRRECLFGEVVNGDMMLSQRGKIADDCWREIPNHFPHVELGAYVIMPNHVHGIIYIVERRGTASYSQGILVPENLDGVELGGKPRPYVKKYRPYVRQPLDKLLPILNINQRRK